MIQVIGKTGMLGTQVMRIAAARGISVCDNFVDVTSVQPGDIRSDIVINCSGAPPSDDKSKMASINKMGPRNLAAACDEAGSRLVHISTDAVFNNPGPHSERDHCSPSAAYGRIKMQGEIRHGKHLTIRTSFIGLGQHGIINQLINTNDTIKASSMFLWSGHTSITVANILIDLALDKYITGLIHIPGEFQSRLDLMHRLVKMLDIDADRIIQDDSYVTDRRLISTRWPALFLPMPPTFEEQIDELSNQYRDTCRAKATSQTVVG